MGSLDTNGTRTLQGGMALRRLLAGDDIVVAPGVYDGFSARIAHEVGFDCIYMVRHPGGDGVDH